MLSYFLKNIKKYIRGFLLIYKKRKKQNLNLSMLERKNISNRAKLGMSLETRKTIKTFENENLEKHFV